VALGEPVFDAESKGCGCKDVQVYDIEPKDLMLLLFEPKWLQPMVVVVLVSKDWAIREMWWFWWLAAF